MIAPSPIRVGDCYFINNNMNSTKYIDLLLEGKFSVKKLKEKIKEYKTLSDRIMPPDEILKLIEALDDKFDMHKESHIFAMIDDIGTSLNIGGYWQNRWHPSAIKYITEDNINRATELLYDWPEYHKKPTKEEIKKLIESIFRIRQTRLEL